MTCHQGFQWQEDIDYWEEEARKKREREQEDEDQRVASWADASQDAFSDEGEVEWY